MLEKIRNYIKEQQMLSSGDHVVIGLSGGADSVCLLLVLKQLQEEFGYTMEAVHIEHGIRGNASLEDAAFVKNLCQEQQIPVRIFSVDIPLLAKENKCSEEEMGRKIRYKMFRKCCKEHEKGKIAVAHHKNDQAETVLFRMVRGSYLRGMEGIRPIEGNCIRPLLCVKRTEIESYLKKRGQKYCEDATNRQNIYHRNRIRNCVIPQLNQVNEAAVEHICFMAQQFGEAAQFIKEQAEEKERFLVKYKNKKAEISSSDFLKQPHIMQKQIAYDVLAKLAGSEKDLTAIHVETFVNLFYKEVGKQCLFPYHIIAWKSYDEVYIKKSDTQNIEKNSKMPIQKIELKLPGETRLPDKKGKIKASLFQNSEKIHQIPRNRYTKWFDYDKINGNVQIRTRQEGDYLVIDAEGRKQSLKKYFINQKVPVEERAKIFLLAVGSEILWVIGYRESKAYWVTDETKNILELFCEIEDK